MKPVKTQRFPTHHIEDVVGTSNAVANRMANLRTIELIDALIAELKGIRQAKVEALGHEPPNPSAVTKVANYLAAHPGSPRRVIANHTGLNPTTVSKAIRALASKGEAIHVGERRGAKWSLASTLTNPFKGSMKGAHR